MIDQKLHEKIEAYLLGKLPPQEVAAFEADIQSDPELAEEVELHRLILPVPDRLAELDLQQDFARWRAELESSPPTPIQPPPHRKSYANVVMLVSQLLLLAGAFWLWRHYEARLAEERAERTRIEKELEAEKLKSETLEREILQLREDMQNSQKPADPVPSAPQPEPEYVAVADQELIAYADEMLESLRGRGIRSDASGEELVDKADSAIINRRYSEARALLTSIRQVDPMYPKSLEMLAYVYFKRKQYAQAVNTYLQYRKFDGNTDKTDWDLCLFYLGDYPRYKSQFQPLLQKIIDDDKHPKRDKAIALRDTLASRGIWPR